MVTTSIKVQNFWHESTSCCALISNPFKIWFRSEFPVTPVPKRIQAGKSTWPGENVSLLWLHIKIQKEISHRVNSNSVKSTTCIQCSIVFKMRGCGGCTWFPWHKIQPCESKGLSQCSTVLNRATDLHPQPLPHSPNGWFAQYHTGTISHIMLFSAFRSLILRGCLFYISHILSLFRPPNAALKHSANAPNVF